MAFKSRQAEHAGIGIPVPTVEESNHAHRERCAIPRRDIVRADIDFNMEETEGFQRCCRSAKRI